MKEQQANNNMKKLALGHDPRKKNEKSCDKQLLCEGI